MDKEVKNLKQGQRIAFLATFVNLVLAIMKGVVGFMFGSPILLADAFHSGGDLLAHAASGFGLWIAARGKTAKFPYGLYRAETLACFIVGVFIIVAGIEIFKQGFEKLFYIDSVGSFPVLPVAASIVSAMVAFFVAKMESKVGRSIGSKSLIANSREAFLDIFTSLVVLIGILLAYFRIPYVDGIIIILIALLLLKLGVENIWTSLLILMDANLDIDLQTEIEEKVNQIYGVKGISKVKIRQSGPFKMVECVIATRPSLSIYKAHELANEVEDFIAENHEHIESVFIHMEPGKEKRVLAMIPVQNIDSLKSMIYNKFARAPYFVVLKLTDKQIDIEAFYKNEYLDDQQHIGVKLARVAIRYKIDLLFTFSIGEISFHMLKDSLIDIYKVKDKLSIKQIINSYQLNQLHPLTCPTHSVEDSQVSR